MGWLVTGQISCTFRWFRVTVGGEEIALKQAGAVYTITGEDVGSAIKAVCERSSSCHTEKRVQNANPGTSSSARSESRRF